MNGYYKNNLKQARQKLGLTQKEMAEKMKTPLRTYQKWEQGVNPVPRIVNVLVAFLLARAKEQQ